MAVKTRWLCGGALFLGGLLGLSGCGSGSSDVGILINLANTPSRINKIAVKATLDGKPGMMDQADIAATGQTRLGVTVPATATGSLNIDLTIYDVDRCTQGKATVMTTLPTTRGAQLTASITQQVPRQCDPLLPCADRTLCTHSKTQTNRLWSIWAIAQNDVWAVGDSSTALHWDGLSWTLKADGLPAGIRLNGVWASGPNDVWAAGSSATLSMGYIYRYDGSRWTQTHSGPRFVNWIHGTSQNDIFAVGTTNATATVPGDFRRWNSATSTWDAILATPTRDLFGVFALSPTDVWIAGSLGTLLRYNGTSINPVTVGATNDLQAVHAYVTSSGQTIAYAVGLSGIVVRYDGAARVTTAGTMPLNGVLATPEAVYATSGGGTVFKSPGITDVFTAFNNGTDTLYGIQQAPNGIAWIAGDRGYTGYIDTRP